MSPHAKLFSFGRRGRAVAVGCGESSVCGVRHRVHVMASIFTPVVTLRRILWFVTMVMAACPPGLSAEPGGQEFAALRSRALRMSKNRSATAADRQAMVAELADGGSVPAARLIIAVGLAAAEPEARSAARATLVQLCGDTRIAAAIMADYRAAAARSDPVAAELAIVLLAGEADAPEGPLRAAFARTSPLAVVPAVAGICAVARGANDAIAVAGLRTLTELPCFAGSLACRRGIVATLAELTDQAALDLLVELMQSLRGEARGDAISQLTRLSGRQLGDDAKAWRAWLDASRAAKAEGKPLEDAPFGVEPADPANEEKRASYYDIPVYADRVVFVLDTSGSMQGPRLEAAKRELESAIFGLPEETFFTVLFFNSGVGPWQRQLVQATDLNKRAAVGFVARLPAEGGTATSDALESAFTFDAEAIFFLSDGAPSAGRITDPVRIVEMVSRLNAGRYLSVNTISIMGGAAFLENLAKANHGSFRAVDN